MKRVLPFAELVEINPRVKLEKGTKYPFVEMGVVESSRRYVHVARVRHFKSGGAKFLAGDTLFARITPCLENGKIAQFQAFKGTAAFGSTEFFVFRARSDISDPAYVYYLAKSDFIRKPAEKSMSGASGRQRADLKSIVDLEVPAPPLPIQRKIAAILSAYDDLIENNLRRIKILEEMAQALYREWFVKFRFPGHENVRMVDSPLGKIPEGWEVRDLGDEIELAYGKGLKKTDRAEGNVPVYGSSGVVGYHDMELVKGPGIIVGRKGNVGSVHWSESDFFPIDTVFYVKTKLSLYYIFYNLQTQNFINTDAAVPGLSRNQAYLLPFLIPSYNILERFEKMIAPFFALASYMKDKVEILKQTRDLLLPELISGELDVSDLDIKTGGHMQ